MKIKTLFPILLTTLLTLQKKPNRYHTHFSDLEIKDEDPVVVRKNLTKKYFANKYKMYSFEDLKKFYYELKLNVTEIPDIKTLKKWKNHKKQDLEIIDHFLEENEKEEYTFKEIMKLIHDDHYLGFRRNRFEEIVAFVKNQHKEDLRKYNEKAFADRYEKEEDEFFTSDL